VKAFSVFLLLSLACLLLFRQRAHWDRAGGGWQLAAGRPAEDGNVVDASPLLPGWHGPAGSAGRARDTRGGSEEMVRLVRELSALLADGRSGSQLWADLISARTDVIRAPTGPFRARAGPSATGFRRRRQTVAETSFILDQLRAAHRAAELGLSPGAAIRSGSATTDSAERPKGALAAWQGLAACLDVAAMSGAPLSDVLLRFAAQLESDLDAAAMRETALAGPKATVRLLTWLPILGLALGMLMGVDPLSVLLGGPVGWSALLAGAALMGAGRYWSRTLIRAAAEPKT
jgi:tight adherence protein B